MATHSPRDQAIKNVALTVAQNLQDQHDWTQLSFLEGGDYPRPLIRALPRKLLYLHPDDQIAALEHEKRTGERIVHEPEFEIVLPVHLKETMSLAKFAAVFDSITDAPVRGKRVVLATLHDDSTVVYYLMHEGIVKPRQN